MHKSLAPRTRTLLGVLGQATLNFVAAATLLFLVFCECRRFCALAKQWRKTFLGVSEVGKNHFSVYCFSLYVFFLVFYFSLLQSRATLEACSNGYTRRSRPLTPFVFVICALFSIGEKWEVAEGNCCCTTSPPPLPT